MSPTHVLLKLVMDEAEVAPGLTTFAERFRLQKKVYLTQLMGLDMRYRFGWYLHGPYSRDLTADAFSVKEQFSLGDTDFKGYDLTQDARSRIGRARVLWDRPEDVGCDDDIWLELLASLHYLRHIVYRPPGSDPDFGAVFEQLVETKPHLAKSRSDAKIAWARLKSTGLIAAKTVRTT